jgi:23S rRNA (uridine2552-2'-O)-methyltransferase
MGKRWIRNKKKDYYYRRAKAEEYRSRAAFKLKQLNKKFRLIKKGDAVVDLGAAPGGWMQVARELVGDRGFVLGVDIARIEPFPVENIAIIRGDFTSPEVVDEIVEAVGRADVLISDASPDISGVWSIDHFRSLELAAQALELCRKVLRPGGNFLVKVFQGEGLEDFVREVRKNFGYVKVTKPRASRSKSSEVYIIGKKFSGSP